jgi:ABC-type multidrug transport system fused ATPase/permease subunit
MRSPEVSWLIHQISPFHGLYLTRLSLVVLTSFLNILDPLIIKWLIDEVLPWRKHDMLLLAALGFFAFFLCRFGLASLSHLIDTYTAQRLTFDIRRKLLRHLQGLSADFFLRTPKGDVLHRLEHDVDQICELGSHSVASLLRVVVMTSMAVTIMLVLNWQLTLFVLSLVPMAVLLRRYGHPRLKAASDHVQAANARRMSFFEGHLATILQVQLLNRGTGERRRFAGIGRDVLDATIRRKGIEVVLSFFSQVTMVAAGAMVLGFGGLQVLRGALTIGGLVAFYSYLSRLFEPMEVVISLYANLQRVSASIRRVTSVLQTRPTILDPPHPRRIEGVGALSVELRDVRFGYQPGHPLLQGLALAIRPGEKVAIVGASGCGKSTIARLVTRLYDPDSGSVLLNGIPVSDLRLKDLRAQVALVPQDPVLFDASLKENLLYARPGASDAELERVLAMAQLAQTLEQLPNGWSEAVGPRGDRLSGGQRQRVAVARAILQDPRLLILDEATSALDGFTEHRLLHGLQEHVRGRTVLVIAHRLSAILWADRIVVLEGGRAVGDGTHGELYRRCEAYRRLCDEQFQKNEPSGDTRAPDPSSLEAIAV